MAAPSVFRSLLREKLDSVCGSLQRFSDAPQGASGTLTVTHHPGRMARFFIWILRLPKEGENLVTRISVKSNPRGEVWTRSIGSSRFVTRHRVVGDLLEERAGLFRFLHEVDVQQGALQYRQVRVYFLGIRLPRNFSPIIDAEAKGDEHGWKLDLVVSCPRCGPICRYEGWVEPHWR